MLRTLALAVAVSLAACQGPAGDVSVLTSDMVSVRPGSSFAWAQVSNSGDPRVANDIIDQRIQSAVNTALAGKGYRMTSDPQQADLLVSYHVALENRTETQIDTFGADPVMCGIGGCFGGWGYYGAPTTTIRDINYTQGQLILDLEDRSSGQLAWRATSSQRVNESDADQARLNAILIDMTQSLPGVAVSPSAG